MRRAAALGALLALLGAAPAGAAVRLTTGPVTALTLEGRTATVRPAAGDAVFLVDAQTGRVGRRVALQGADAAHVSGARLATVALESPDSHRLLDESTLAIAALRAPLTELVHVHHEGGDGRVWSTSLRGRGGLVAATRDRYEPSPGTPDCLDGGECEWVRSGRESFVWSAATTVRRALPPGRVLDADATRVLLLAGREFLTTNARGRVIARLTLPASLQDVDHGLLGGGGRVLLVASAAYSDAAIVLRGGRPVWTGSITATAGPAFDGARIVWATGSRVWLRDARTPGRRLLVARCPVGVSAVAVSGARVAWACRGRGAGAWATTVRS